MAANLSEAVVRFNADIEAAKIHVDNLEDAVNESSVKLKDMYESDDWSDDKVRKYEIEQLHHAQLSRELASGREAFQIANDKKSTVTFTTKEKDTVSQFLMAPSLAHGIKELEERGEENMLIESSTYGVGIKVTVNSGHSNIFAAATASDSKTAGTGGMRWTDTVTEGYIVDTLQFGGGIEGAVKQISTATGNNLEIPQADSANEAGVILGSQDTAVTEDALAVGNSVVFTSRTFSSQFIDLTREMIQDAVVDIGSYATSIAMRRIGLRRSQAFTTGTGTNQPLGLVTSAAAGTTAASQTAITFDEVFGLEYQVDKAYRVGNEGFMNGFTAQAGAGMVGYMVSDDCERVLRLLKDTDGRPLWQPSLQAGAPNTFFGYPIIVNGSMAAVGAGATVMVFGNLGYYCIRNVSSMELYRFWDSGTALYNRIRILGFHRADGRPIGVTDSSNLCEAYKKYEMKA